jgi:AhpD family alkylhydroperoxidase
VFTKRILTLSAFTTSVWDIFDHLGDLRHAILGGRVDRAFAERVMMAVTQVNGCRYCSFVHTKAALLSGVTSEEIRAIQTSEFDKIPTDQVAALMFAQHYAEMDGNPDPEAWQRMITVYGADITRDLMVYFRLISLANLWGNTFDALLSRLAGRPAPGSSVLQEFGVVFGWVVIVPICITQWLVFRQRIPVAAPHDQPASGA